MILVRLDSPDEHGGELDDGGVEEPPVGGGGLLSCSIACTRCVELKLVLVTLRDKLLSSKLIHPDADLPMSSVFMVFGSECTSQLLAVNIYSGVIFEQVLVHFYPVSRTGSFNLTVATICISMQIPKVFVIH